MNLLHPWYLLGLAAVALPIAVHYLTRPRPRVLPLSTIRFVRQAVQQKRARHRLRDWIVLALRGLAVILLAMAFSRPLIGAKHVARKDSSNAVRIVILDQSQSMAAISNGVQAFERARTAAASHLTYAPSLQGDLILAGAKPRAVFPSPSTNFTALKDELASAKPRSESLNLKAAIDLAGEMLAKVPPGRKRELFVVSDFQRSNWVAADFTPLPKETEIRLESVAPAQAPANLAVLRAGAAGRVEQGREARLEVEVGNYSPNARDVQVEVSVGGASYRLAGHCSPGMTSVLTTDAVFPATGWQGGEARLVGIEDALPADNARFFTVNVRPPLTYLLLTRDSPQPHVSSSQFLERALVPLKSGEGRPGERVVRADPDSFDRDAVAAADVIVLDHPGRLSAEWTKLLASLVRRGRALLYVAAEPIDASNLSLLADAAGSDLRMPVQFVPPAAGTHRQGLFIASTSRGQGVFNFLGDNVAAALAPLRFGGGLDSRKLDTGLADDVLATFSDRSAALVVTNCGAGKLAVLNADLGESNLPASSIFVPLMGELAGRLTSRTDRAEASPCGELLVASLPPEVTGVSGLSLTGANKSGDSLGSLSEENGLVTWRWDEAGPPGVYEAKRGPAAVFALATAIPASESDLTAIDPQLLTGRLAGGRTIHFASAGRDEAKPETAWSWIAAVCAACMLLELAALKFFRT